MATLSFQTLSFEQEEGKSEVKVSFMKIFYFFIDDSELKSIGKYSIGGAGGNSITFDANEDYAQKKFNLLLEKGFRNLASKVTGKPAVYVHRNSGIPLIGNVSFGIVDRDVSVIEVKPLTGCNLKCIFCSVDQEKRQTDFIVEREYLVEEFKKLVAHKGIEGIEAHIASQGEPLLYSEIVELVRDLRSIRNVKVISIDTNGTLLTKKLVDSLVDAGLTRFNFSINALNKELACKLAGTAYDLKHILEMIDYISKKANIIITPVWVPGFNDSDIEKLVELAGKRGLEIGIQNFLNYRFGKNPSKQKQWKDFYEDLARLEKKYKIKLVLDLQKEFSIRKTKPLEKPFRKGDRVIARIVCPGRLSGECIAAAQGRSISVPDCKQGLASSGKAKDITLKITRSKHNVYYGLLSSAMRSGRQAVMRSSRQPNRQ
jgi:uncharacterized Fe-S cluster-containing radical SAM superfamily enzyme